MVLLAPRLAAAQQEAPAPAGSGASFAQFGDPGEVSTAPEAPAKPPSASRLSEPQRSALPSQQPLRFGQRGQFALIAGSQVGISSASYSNSMATSFDVTFEPSLEYFVVRNFSFGIELDAYHSHARGYWPYGLVDVDSTLLGAGLHFGWNVPLVPELSLYSMLSVGFHHIEETESATRVVGSNGRPLPQVTSTRLGPWLSGNVSILYHPVEHLFFGLGPAIYQDFSRATGGVEDHRQRLNVGAQVALGGYFDFRPQPTSADTGTHDDEPTSVRPRQFGHAGTVVITEESGLSWTSKSYSGSDTSTFVSIAGGFDWFVADAQSLGASAFYRNSSHVVEFYGDTEDVHAIGISGRYGVALPCFSWLSVYPRLSLQYSVEDGRYDQTGESHSKIITLSFFVPALVHLAPHFFVGLGPSVSNDLMHTEQRGEDVRRTAFGAGTLIGGWL